MKNNFKYMFLLQKLWIKKHKKHLILLSLLFVLTNLTTFLMTTKLWKFKLISVVDNCQTTKVQHKKIVAFNPKIPTQKIFI